MKIAYYQISLCIDYIFKECDFYTFENNLVYYTYSRTQNKNCECIFILLAIVWMTCRKFEIILISNKLLHEFYA